MLTVLEQQLAEAHGLAIAASETVDRVESRLDGDKLRRTLDALRFEAGETRGRCLDAERSFGVELAAELQAHANLISERASAIAGTWFKAGTGPLSAWTFLAMGEAAEVVAWSALRSLAARGGSREVLELADWAVHVQRRHLELVLEGATLLAERSEPTAPRFG
jgi:hypothetical protein